MKVIGKNVLLSKADVDSIKNLLTDFSCPITFFEKKVLLPEVKYRLTYLRSIYENFIQICDDPNLAVAINESLRNLVKPALYPPVMQPSQVGTAYLNIVMTTIRDDFIAPIDVLLAASNDTSLENEISKLTQFFTDVLNFLESIIATESTVFYYSIRTFFDVTTESGKRLIGAPDELRLILVPFQTRLLELVNVAKVTMESIRLWHKQILEERKKHVEILIRASEVRVATEQVRASKYMLLFQLLVIVFSIALVIVSQKANLYLEKRDLEDALQSCKTKLSDVLLNNQAQRNQFQKMQP